MSWFNPIKMYSYCQELLFPLLSDSYKRLKPSSVQKSVPTPSCNDYKEFHEYIRRSFSCLDSIHDRGQQPNLLFLGLSFCIWHSSSLVLSTFPGLVREFSRSL